MFCENYEHPKWCNKSTYILKIDTDLHTAYAFFYFSGVE